MPLSISITVSEIAAYWSKIATPLYLAPPFYGGEVVRFEKRPLVSKNYRFMCLSDSERISMILSAVLIQYTRVTDGQTDGRAEFA